MLILCTKTGRRTPAVSDVSRDEFETMNPTAQHSSRCWECGGVHVWSKRWAEFVDAAIEPANSA